MIRSMTGFGRYEEVIDGRNILVEIRSVNHRYSEISTKISRGYGFIEDKLKKFVSKKISRGKIDITINIQTLETENVEVIINYPLALGYIEALNELKEKYDLKGDISVSLLSRYQDILTIKSSNVDENKIIEDVLFVAKKALDKLILMREKEGMSLQEDIKLKSHNIRSALKLIEEKVPSVISNYEKRLKTKISELISDYNIDEQRVLTEVAIFADKTAIDEEIVRLKSHLDQFSIMLESDSAVGRKMDFLVQEMNREANTIGSKSADSEILHIVVDIKADIEKIREQVQNIE